LEPRRRPGSARGAARPWARPASGGKVCQQRLNPLIELCPAPVTLAFRCRVGRSRVDLIGLLRTT
jgi:hypothetical protein